MRRMICSMASAFSVTLAAPALAREPGIASVIPPGLTLGQPIAISPPPGLYLTTRTSYYAASLYDANGDYAGQQTDVFAEAFQVTLVPGWTMFGADYKTFLMMPFVNVDQMREFPFQPAPAHGQMTEFGLGNPKLQVADLSWNLGDGFYVSVGLGVYAPLGKWGQDAGINIGANFWTFEPSVGFTYFKDGWNASLHVLYNTNTENRDTEYRSGDQIFVNATLTKNVAGFNIGPVAYYQKQVTPDRNNGLSFGGRVFEEPEQFAIGATIGKQLGPVNVQLMYTHDVVSKNTIGGNKVWLNLTFKLH